MPLTYLQNASDAPSKATLSLRSYRVALPLCQGIQAAATAQYRRSYIEPFHGGASIPDGSQADLICASPRRPAGVERPFYQDKIGQTTPTPGHMPLSVSLSHAYLDNCGVMPKISPPRHLG
jgi:hypothetical protein